MTDENKDIITPKEPTLETVEDKTTETEQTKEETPKVETPQDGINRQTPGILERVANILKGKKSEVASNEETSEEPTSEGTEKTGELETEDEGYEEIDPHFVDVARRYGWDDQRIVKYAEDHSDEDIVNMSILLGV